jgi:hypothetical protein
MATPAPPPGSPKRKRRPFKRRHTIRARADLVYSLLEITRLCGISEQTVRNWCKAGLERVPGTSRFLVCGDKLNAFLDARLAASRQPLAATEFFCLKCHRPREPSLGSVRMAHQGQRTTTLKARCLACSTRMFRAVSKETAEAFLARQNPGPASMSTATAQPSNPTSLPQEMRRNDPNCDSVIHGEPRFSPKPTQTTERPADTIGLAQLTLPFEV